MMNCLVIDSYISLHEDVYLIRSRESQMEKGGRCNEILQSWIELLIFSGETIERKGDVDKIDEK